MVANKNKKPARAKLGWIGVWATVWWGVSCFYVLLLFWIARHNYGRYLGLPSLDDSLSSTAHWWSMALRDTYHSYVELQILLVFIVVIWVIGGYFWLQALRRQKVGYKAGFKDLFLTIRR